MSGSNPARPEVREGGGLSPLPKFQSGERMWLCNHDRLSFYMNYVSNLVTKA